MKREEMDFGTRFWNVFCGFRFMLRLLFAICVTFLVLIGAAYFFIGTDREGLVVLQLSLIVVGILIPILLYSLRRCNEHERR